MSSMLRRHLYNGILEIIKDNNLYCSSILLGSNSLNERGVNELHQFVLMIALYMLKSYEKEINDQAKKMIVEGLKQ